MIPSIELSQRELVHRLRDLVDYVADPESRLKDPQKFAESYARLMNLISLYPDKLEKKFVRHNVGQRRLDYIERLLGHETGGSKA